MSLLSANKAYKPFEYPWAFEFWKRQQQVHWMPEEVPLGEDCRDWARKLTDHERNLLTQIFRFFTQADVEVQDCYHEKYGRVFKPTEIKMMLAAFSNMECFDAKSELLTASGWKNVANIGPDDLVAQYDIATETISFTKPNKVVSYDYTGVMHAYRNRTTDICVTPNHDLIARHPNTRKVDKVKSCQRKLGGNYLYPASGKGDAPHEDLDCLQRILIATQADGCLRALTPAGGDWRTVDFTLHKQRKVDRLLTLLREAKIKFSHRFEGDRRQRISFRLPREVDVNTVKNLSFIDLTKISPQRAAQILDEVVFWDGTVNRRTGQRAYYSASEDAAGMVQAIACLSGQSMATVGINRGAGAKMTLPGGKPYETTKPVYVVTLVDGRVEKTYPDRVEEPYDGKVYCVSVNTENLVSRRNGKVAFTGNTIHIAAYSHLLDTIGMPEAEYTAFLRYKEMADKHDYLQRFGVDTDADIARTLAVFGGFTEGLQLFASFAMLMNFPRFNKMKGMGQIVSWSVRDECVSSDTEVLTPEGWVAFPDLAPGQPVLQYDPETRGVSFVVPDRIVRKPYKGKLHVHNKRQFNLAATPNHDILFEEAAASGRRIVKAKASEFIPHTRRGIPVTGRSTRPETSLTALDKLRIAYAADGAVISSENRTGERVGYQRVQFAFTKRRKIDRLLALCTEAGVVCDELQKQGKQRRYAVNMPIGVSKSFSDWVNLSDIDARWGREFIEELTQWDGYVRKGRRIFCSTNKRDIDTAQAIAVVSGISTTLTKTADVRKETYKDYYRLSFWENTTTPSKADTAPALVDYDGEVFCVSVPTGCFAIRRNGAVHMTGNSLHCEGITKLYHTFAAETGCLTASVKDDIADCCQTVVRLEDAFIDLAFEMGPVEGMTPRDVKRYIRYIADWRLQQLGLKPIYLIDDHPLPWLPALLNGVEHANFFEARATEYSKAATQGDWDSTWTMFDQRATRR